MALSYQPLGPLILPRLNILEAAPPSRKLTVTTPGELDNTRPSIPDEAYRRVSTRSS